MQEPQEAEKAAAELPFPSIQEVTVGAPFRWLALAWGDLRSCPIPSLFYGFCFAGMASRLKNRAASSGTTATGNT